MAKLDRIKQEIFASSAGSREITAFGTAKNETPTYSTDVGTIQNNNYLQGWSAAILPDRAPYMEDTNALFYAITRQLAYLLQAGIPEWNAETSYYVNNLCTAANSAGDVTIYKSLTNDNTGNNPLTDTTNWKVFQSEHAEISLATYEIGLPQPTLSNTLYSNEIWLEGQAVSRTTYADLFNIYGTTYGTGNGSTTFNLPDFRNRVMWGSTSFGYLAAGLPNITGGFNASKLTDHSEIVTGAFSVGGMTWRDTPACKGDSSQNGFTFDASRSNNIYGRSSTVQPPAIKVRVKTRWY